MTGRTLRLSRLRLGLRQRDVADAAGCSRARVGQVEQLGKVPRVWVDRYRRALADRGLSEPTTTTKAEEPGYGSTLRSG